MCVSLERFCAFGWQISERSLAAASEEGQRSQRILSQYGSRSCSSAAQRLAMLSSFVRTCQRLQSGQQLCL